MSRDSISFWSTHSGKGTATANDPLGHEVEWLAQHLNYLEHRLERVENSLFFRALRATGRIGNAIKQKLLLLGPRGMRDALVRRCYRSWLERNVVSAPGREWHNRQVSDWGYRPEVDIFLRMRGVLPARVRSVLESLCRQTYTNWQLVPDDPYGLAVAWDAAGLSDVKVTDLNSASGDYVAFVDANDVLDPYALHYVIGSIQSKPVDLIYADEDLVDSSGNPIAPAFKPDWSPALLEQIMYLGNFLTVRRECLDRAFGETEWITADRYDIARQLGHPGARVVHIPRVLNHCREVGRAVAGKQHSQIVFRQQFEPVSVIICSRQPRLLRRCLQELRRTVYPAVEIVIVQHETGDESSNVALRVVTEQFGCRGVRFCGLFNFPEMNNLGASVACGNYLVFVNDDVWPLTADWLEKLTAPLSQARTGITGAKLLYPNGSIQHAGIAVGINGAAAHPGRGLFYSPYWKWLDYTREVSAVTGACLAIRRDVFDKLGGFDPIFPVNYNDVDLCLRARLEGYRVLIETSALLWHSECQSRKAVVKPEERRAFYKRWSSVLQDSDPYYNPNLTQDSESAGLGQCPESEIH
jgi:GT2 family glycosyltransferase